MYELRRIVVSEGTYTVLGEAETREELDDLLHHYLAGPDGPAVGSRYADYAVVEVADHTEARERLEYLRSQIEAERISYGEIAELQELTDYIDPDDVVLLEWAGVPEFGEEREAQARAWRANQP